MPKHRLHDFLREELAALAALERRLHPLALILEVVTTRGYDDLFEALQNTPERRTREETTRRTPERD